MLKFFIFFIFVSTKCVIFSSAINFPQLKLLSVIFRHGDREPDDSQGGDLTMTGRQRAYHLGEAVRARYGSFLGEAYEPEAVSARSTSYARAKLSLELALAGLYVPAGRQRWHASLAWQPIPFATAPPDDDILLFPIFCPRFVRELKKAESTPEFQKLLDPYRDMMKNLTVATGKEMKTSNDMFLLYHKLASLQSMNQSLPSWTRDIFPDGLLLNGTYLEYDVLKSTDWMRKINGGALVRKVIDDMLAKTNDESRSRRKLFLYSSHELIIVSVLQTLKIWRPHIPAYTSAIVLELREDRKNYFVKVLYFEGIPPVFREMQIPGCPSLCPLARFVELVSDQLPAREEMTCDDRPARYREMTAA